MWHFCMTSRLTFELVFEGIHEQSGFLFIDFHRFTERLRSDSVYHSVTQLKRYSLCHVLSVKNISSMARAHLLCLRSLFTRDVINSDSFPLRSDGSENVTFAVQNVDEFAIVGQVRDDAQFELRVVGCEEHSAWSTRQHKCIASLIMSRL